MATTGRTQQRYDHRLRTLVQRTGDVTVVTDLGVPRSTARGWLGAARTVVVCLDVADLREPELRQEVLKLRRRVRKLTVCRAETRSVKLRVWGAKTRSRCKDVLVDQSAETITTLDANLALLGRRRN